MLAPATATAAVAALALFAGVAADNQVPLQVEMVKPKRQLTGRFMHVTDFHPDPYYKVKATLESGCHRLKGEQDPEEEYKRRRKNRGKNRMDRDDEDIEAGEWGTPISDCDSPITLVDLAFDWLKKEWVEQVDFVVWTGDSARHDIDRFLPRSGKEIFDLNRMMAQRMVNTFGKKVPIIPSLGNNDVYPHNIMEPGPNRVTQEFLKIWKHFIPEEYRHVFERGGYFAVEVIPDQLAVISLNTIYFFVSNSAVDGCRPGSGEPGDLEMEWLEVQLQGYRDRGMQVHLIGHVAPHEGLYYDDCYLRYGDLALRYQDTLVGHHYGHQNIDHFFFMDVPELEAISQGESAALNGTRYLEIEPKDQLLQPTVDDYSYPGPEIHGPHFLESGRFKIFGRKKSALLLEQLKKSFSGLPGPTELKYKDYTVINVAPSIIPTYQPAARIYSYNISGVTLNSEVRQQVVHAEPDDPMDAMWKARKGDCKKPENMYKPHCSFKTRPRYASPDSPSRSNKPFTTLGYTQFYIPNLDQPKKSQALPGWEIEYTTFSARSLLPESLTNGIHKAYGQPPPVPYHLLPAFDPDIVDLVTADEVALLDAEDDVPRAGPDTDHKKEQFLRAIKRITPWKLKDLTINSYVKFARRLANDKKAFKKFLVYMFVSSCPGNTC
ncbi:hypothetical protein CcaverHIS002_0110060 [Cutaneotrichosporon cavernicola]|uniref:Endopolyphosphatase n=1 Tax=Cutaneotrichosporon cavernicola TaxID=279322 RepID=A0AA48L121_9TREE|nr:uncharacterized protein CcaverHIS019_0110000 [Cutaneotrichosporon cavernicola]BEI80477.1 hypothetical protein CcaverHIS002_0110060 [Cutaneotrichosporon cavernicola]BEI88282.1 hypothetical protein CcaverHIS019_0110000 [Cutaneotrichosporon cavernicola]BEI96054.1 hypothetical protein CcaverHIS631_0110030 [Cutaneotrichosporon cavernicola]BEJ03826.1 hypothetical protein CcaverHIS641_0110010 [Cutaneotrichosporon cavernicola]